MTITPPSPPLQDTWSQPDKILVGKSTTGKQHDFQYLTLGLGNRHGLVTGATGTGKTVTLQVLAEGFSTAGAAVFAADVKGDLSGLAMAGDAKPPFVQRAKDIGISYVADRFPIVFWDLFGDQGHPIRATISEMGPLLMARLLELNDTQEGVLNIAFKIADEQGLLLLDLKDLRALLQYLADNAASITDLMRTDRDGRGVINILAADKLMRSPRLYATFLLWMLSELFEQLPEVGDPEVPKLVFFFDEAHLLFDNAPKSLMTAIEQVVRLIRSKGVGVFFVTQNPLDVPDTVLGQLGNRAQHALRAFTPRDQKAVKAAADTFRQNPDFDTAKVITELAVGEALVSMLEGKGTPAIVSRTLVAPPSSRVGPITPDERAGVIKASPLLGKYETAIDRQSAFEILAARTQGRNVPGAAQPDGTPASAGQSGGDGGLLGSVGGFFGGLVGHSSAPAQGGRARMTTGQIMVRSVAQSVARSVGTQIAHAVIRGLLGGMSR